MDFDVAYRLKLFSSQTWIDVQATLLADVLLLVSTQNKTKLSEFWTPNTHIGSGKFNLYFIFKEVKIKNQNLFELQ